MSHVFLAAPRNRSGIQYDSLNRLATATSSVNPGWGQSYTYDGFGNLTNQTVTKGTAPSLSVTYDPATNRQTGECADANGNLNSAPTCWNQAMYYDVENRPVKNSGYLAWAYSYAPGNKRVWRGVWDTNNTQTVDEVTFWGVNGQKLTTYSLSMYYNQFVATSTGSNYYFGGKLIKNATGYVTPDRLGSIGKYFPYGQERPSATTDGKEKFATYFRDSETGLDYADQRYHQPGMGRFMTPDPFSGSASANDPGSWNRYPYSNGHLLIAPARHIPDLGQATDQELMEMIKLVRESQKALTLAIKPHGFNVGMNFSRCAGAGLPGHVHIHVVPRWEGDTNFMAVCSGIDVISQSLAELLALLRKITAEHQLPKL